MPSHPSGVSCILPTLSDNVVTRVLVGPTETFEGIVCAAHNALQCTDVKKKPILTWKLSVDKRSSPAARLDTADEWAIALDRVRTAKSNRRKANREGVEIVIGVADPLVFSFLFGWPLLTNPFPVHRKPQGTSITEKTACSFNVKIKDKEASTPPPQSQC